MNKMEQAALNHAKEWIRYAKSPQAAIDLANDKGKRDSITIKQGHLLTCSLTKCDPKCQRCD